MTPQRTLDELLHHMKALARNVENDWEAKFARSTLRQAKRPNWRPSDKQFQIMHRMVAEMFVRGDALDDGELELVDRGDWINAA